MFWWSPARLNKEVFLLCLFKIFWSLACDSVPEVLPLKLSRSSIWRKAPIYRIQRRNIAVIYLPCIDIFGHQLRPLFVSLISFETRWWYSPCELKRDATSTTGIRRRTISVTVADHCRSLIRDTFSTYCKSHIVRTNASFWQSYRRFS